MSPVATAVAVRASGIGEQARLEESGEEHGEAGIELRPVPSASGEALIANQLSEVDELERIVEGLRREEVEKEKARADPENGQENERRALPVHGFAGSGRFARFGPITTALAGLST